MAAEFSAAASVIPPKAAKEFLPAASDSKPNAVAVSPLATEYSPQAVALLAEASV